MRSFFNYLGSVLAIVGIFFVLKRLYSHWPEINFTHISISGWAIVFFLSIVYGASNSLLSIAWFFILENLGAKLQKCKAIRIYGISQISRYAPGNIFHFVGRQAMGMAGGVPSIPLMKSTGWELVLIIISGGLFGLIVIPALMGFDLYPIDLLLVVGSILFTGAILKRRYGLNIGRAFFLQTCFLLISGIIFLLILLLLQADVDVGLKNITYIVGAYIVSWLIGLVTPGSPAGIGVREIILITLLGGIGADTEILIAALTFRILTIFGDMLFFLVSLCFDFHPQNANQ